MLLSIRISDLSKFLHISIGVYWLFSLKFAKGIITFLCLTFLLVLVYPKSAIQGNCPRDALSPFEILFPIEPPPQSSGKYWLGLNLWKVCGVCADSAADFGVQQIFVFPFWSKPHSKKADSKSL